MSSGGDTIEINAWTGDREDGSRGRLAEGAALDWSTRHSFPEYPSNRAAREPPNQGDWRHREVGWGLVLPFNAGLSKDDLATAIDAPEPVQRLCANRPDSPVLRYYRTLFPGVLLRYERGGRVDELAITECPRGVEAGRIPWYLLIYASPRDIPWEVQYRLSLDAYVGRLDLALDALKHYVAALLNDWRDCRPQRAKPVVWGVDRGSGITRLMNQKIAAPLAETLKGDSEISALKYHVGRDATVANLRQSLRENRPALVVTTSHGRIAPLSPAPRL